VTPITFLGVSMMSHAAVVCREYGMPAVVSAGFASSRLKTGSVYGLMAVQAA
jgi:pyruvate,water dikinase